MVNLEKIIGFGEVAVCFSLFYLMGNSYRGDAPLGVGVSYAVIHASLVLDSVSRIFFNCPFYRAGLNPQVIDKTDDNNNC